MKQFRKKTKKQVLRKSTSLTDYRLLKIINHKRSNSFSNNETKNNETKEKKKKDLSLDSQKGNRMNLSH